MCVQEDEAGLDDDAAFDDEVRDMPADADDLDAPGQDARVELVLEVPAGAGGTRLDRAAAQLLPRYSRARLQQWIRSGELRLDGRHCEPKHRVLGGERLSIDAHLPATERWVPQDVPFDVVAEDASIIVVSKPAGLVVHPGAGNPDGTLVNGLLHRFPELARVPRAGIVHRLDKDTTGLLVVARTLDAHGALVRQLQARSVGRRYDAVVEGAPVSGRTIDEPIGRDPNQRTRMAVVSSGRPAITHFRIDERYRAHTRVRCELETGRTHQIRVHLSWLGHPLVGDRLYGARGRLPEQPAAELVEAIRGFRRQALHARALRLVHPDSGREVAFEQDAPPDFEALCAALAADRDLHG